MAITLVVEDGTGYASANTFVSLADADTYHENRITLDTSQTWNAETDDENKKASLIAATDYICQHYANRWTGVKYDSDNALCWPRGYAYDGEGYAISVTSIPTAIMNATCEAAARILSENLSPDLERGGGLKYKKIGPIEKEYFPYADASKTFPAIEKWLAGLVTSDSTVRLVRS